MFRLLYVCPTILHTSELSDALDMETAILYDILFILLS